MVSLGAVEAGRGLAGTREGQTLLLEGTPLL